MPKKAFLVALVAAIAVIVFSAVAVLKGKRSSGPADGVGTSLGAEAAELAGRALQPGTETATPNAGRGLGAIQSAAESRRYLFVFFYKSEDEPTQTMRRVFDAAMQRVADRAESIAINAADPSEKGIVDKFNVSRAPMPLALALASNGAITGGFPMKFDEKQLLEAMVSPCMEKCLKPLQQRKLVLLCVQNAATRFNDEAMGGVGDFKADSRFGEATEIVTVDPGDPREAKFLNNLQIDPGTDEAITALLAPPGAVIAKFTGATDKQRLITALVSAMSSCGSGCGPSGCGP
jgi:hypothetical protein